MFTSIKASDTAMELSMAQQRDGARPNNLNPLDIWRSNRAAIDGTSFYV